MRYTVHAWCHSHHRMPFYNKIHSGSCRPEKNVNQEDGANVPPTEKDLPVFVMMYLILYSEGQNFPPNRKISQERASSISHYQVCFKVQSTTMLISV